jgi:Flp pilus assembly protein TadB
MRRAAVTSTNGRGPARRKARPYRDSLLIYAAFGAIVIVIGVATGGKVLQVVIAGVAAFILATGLQWRALRKRRREQEQTEKQR